MHTMQNFDILGVDKGDLTRMLNLDEAFFTMIKINLVIPT